jgi:hypothetical protein
MFPVEIDAPERLTTELQSEKMFHSFPSPITYYPLPFTEKSML